MEGQKGKRLSVAAFYTIIRENNALKRDLSGGRRLMGTPPRLHKAHERSRWVGERIRRARDIVGGFAREA